jgi:hypothetical protein
MRFLFGWQGMAVVGFIGIAVGLHLAFTDLLLDRLHNLRRNRLHVGGGTRAPNAPVASEVDDQPHDAA